MKNKDMNIRVSSLEIKGQLESMMKKEKLDFMIAEKFLSNTKK